MPSDTSESPELAGGLVLAIAYLNTSMGSPDYNTPFRRGAAVSESQFVGSSLVDFFLKVCR